MTPLFSTTDSGQYDLVLISGQLASVLSYHQEAPTSISSLPMSVLIQSGHRVCDTDQLFLELVT